jgi:molecular chaperone GrpE
MSQTPSDPNPTEAGDTPGGEASGASVVESPTSELEAKVHELEARLRTVSAAYRQKQDEIESTKRRLEERAALNEEIRRGELVASLFEPVENLHRSLDAAKGTAAEQGLRMVYQQFMGALHKLGLEEVPGAGAPFDPALHEAIATAPVAEADQDGVVQSVFSAGYRIGTRLIRPARVVIGSYAPSAEA